MDEERIRQFQKMTQDDPANELGHFSLGKLYFDAGRFPEAIPSFRRVLELNPNHTKSYQLLATSLEKLGDRAGALATLKKGYPIAVERGDVMPRDAMAAMLRSYGEEVGPPERKMAPPAAAAATAEAGGFRCSRCGRPSGKMRERPFKGPLGEAVWANACADCWREWIGMGTKVINELGLQLSSPRGQQVYDEHLREFLQLPAP
ncbi:MAG TPA: Fe(2+)-trafficking protein [Phycisphaerae bacterium]|jgi:tetratricopeptide (TPR) repeat protein